MDEDRYPGYDVLAKWNTPSWNEQTRRVVAARLAVPREPRFFSEAEWRTLEAVCDRIIPQPRHRAKVPLAAYVDAKMFENRGDGHRHATMPQQREAWKRGLAALDAAARRGHGAPFRDLAPTAQDALLTRMQKGELTGPEWGGMPSRQFFADRLLFDIATAYYAHPTAWSEIGFGGPASPRGYVRMGFDRRDPWEAAEAKPGGEARARRKNAHV